MEDPEDKTTVGFCHWVGADVAHGHFPVSSAVFKEWSAEIKAEQTTLDVLPPKLWSTLNDARDRLKLRSHHKKKPGVNTRVQYLLVV